MNSVSLLRILIWNCNDCSSFAADIDLELQRLQQLESAIANVEVEIQQNPTLAPLLYESLALKLHNFYTGCERVFQLIATEFDGSLPSGFDWHKRLLDRMSHPREGRQSVVSIDTVQRLQEYLGFRHIVRNIYGFELDVTRLTRLVEGYPMVWNQTKQ
ncbi:MAG: hypothetical protein MUF49_30665, partial [Oculatellaceae cyanobacterium Prado106]|nr:hypothetical protein [Oculatellaceae cyanobacterium Prado106]